jgi:hypothetical protein
MWWQLGTCHLCMHMEYSVCYSVCSPSYNSSHRALLNRSSPVLPKPKHPPVGSLDLSGTAQTAPPRPCAQARLNPCPKPIKLALIKPAQAALQELALNSPQDVLHRQLSLRSSLEDSSSAPSGGSQGSGSGRAGHSGHSGGSGGSYSGRPRQFGLQRPEALKDLKLGPMLGRGDHSMIS